MRKINKFGRSYWPGVALDQDFKCLIIDSIISYGGDRMTGYITRSLTQLADEFQSMHFELFISTWVLWYHVLTITPTEILTNVLKMFSRPRFLNC